MVKKSGSGIQVEHPRSFFREVEKVFGVSNPGWKNLDPGTATLGSGTPFPPAWQIRVDTTFLLVVYVRFFKS
jgi:hypothetical protein